MRREVGREDCHLHPIYVDSYVYGLDGVRHRSRWRAGHREDRIVLAAHNGHIQRGPGILPGMAPITPMGLHLADRLGQDYLVIGATSGTGQILNNGPTSTPASSSRRWRRPSPAASTRSCT
ncbi:erythromycin esterase family protein, partial [Nonomuraea jabiensis]|uniref:erythromycin esterase family protein n=1 Tax=Nonomuraea jabiensis TaxID=882448 RepID=UPI003D74B365